MTDAATAERPAYIVHEAAGRLRLRCPRHVPLADLRVQLELLPGVSSVHVASSIRSATVRYDDRRPTRAAILNLVDGLASHPDHGEPRPRPRRVSRRTLRPSLAGLATAAIPLAPAGARPALALGALAARTLARPAEERQTAGFLLDTLSLATTALTGHPATTGASILLGSLAEVWRDDLLRDADRLLEHLSPPADPSYRAIRDDRPHSIQCDRLRAGDIVSLAAGQVVPADGLVRKGAARMFPMTQQQDPRGRPVRRGSRLASGERVGSGAVDYVVERPADRSQARRMRDHIRHTLRRRETPGGLTPNLERLTALPVTAASLVLAITRDAGRTAAMLQADPQHGLLVAHPVAREAALYSLARQGMLGTGLETVERLARATTLAVEDIRILTERHWRVVEVRSPSRRLRRDQVESWLARLAGIEPEEASVAGFRDRQVAEWLEHGAVVSDPPRTLHIAGAEPLRRTWTVGFDHPDRGSLERVLGIVDGGRLLGSVKLRVGLRTGTAAHLGQLRDLGFRRIVILTEDLEEHAGPELEALGGNAVVSSSRAAQAAYLERAVEEGERVVLLHTGLRDLLPPGGLSLCPAEAEAGAHGVLLGDPLASLVAARAVATILDRRLRQHFGSTTALNAALMVASGLRLVPPIATATMHHAVTFALLRSSMKLAEVRAARSAT